MLLYNIHSFIKFANWVSGCEVNSKALISRVKMLNISPYLHLPHSNKSHGNYDTLIWCVWCAECVHMSRWTVDTRIIVQCSSKFWLKFHHVNCALYALWWKITLSHVTNVTYESKVSLLAFRSKNWCISRLYLGSIASYPFAGMPGESWIYPMLGCKTQHAGRWFHLLFRMFFLFQIDSLLIWNSISFTYVL